MKIRYEPAPEQQAGCTYRFNDGSHCGAPRGYEMIHGYGAYKHAYQSPAWTAPPKAAESKLASEVPLGTIAVMECGAEVICREAGGGANAWRKLGSGHQLSYYLVAVPLAPGDRVVLEQEAWL